MQRRILKHLTKYTILSTEQYGFRLGLRTDNATYKLTTEILNAMNNKLLVGGIFCDLEKAFYCVNHDILLSKMKLYGISDKEITLINLKWVTDIVEQQYMITARTVTKFQIGQNETWSATRFCFGTSTFSFIYK